MRKSVKSMVDEAMDLITTYSVDDARALHGRDDVQFIDLRDVRELEREGVIPGAFHAPRGLLEFWVDPESPYHKPVFAQDKQFVLFCAAGWRSALATRTLQEMGLDRVAHIDGGFTAWKEAGAPVAEKAEKGLSAMGTLDLPHYLRIQARANRLANHRLHGSMRALSRDEFDAPRTGFFPSLARTLNHILAVDGYYLDALTRAPDAAARYTDFRPAHDIAELAARQAASDERLIGFCEALDAAGCAAGVEMDRGDHVQRDLAGHVLAHLFMHQTHHRGQVHSMLAGSTIAPPQLDEFLMPSDASLRTADMAALAWTEAEVYGSR